MCDHESSYGHLCLNPRGKTVVVTATNYCPASRIGWCNAPNKHFDIAEVAFSQISEYSAQPVPVLYKRYVVYLERGSLFERDRELCSNGNPNSESPLFRDCEVSVSIERKQPNCLIDTEI